MEEKETEVPRTTGVGAGDFVMVESTDKHVWVVNFRHVTDLRFSNGGRKVEVWYTGDTESDPGADFGGDTVKALYDRMVCEAPTARSLDTVADVIADREQPMTTGVPFPMSSRTIRAPGPLASHEIGR